MRDGAPTEETIEAVERDLIAWRGASCSICSKPICGHEALFSRLMGFRGALHCFPCLVRAVGREARELRDHLTAHVGHRDCYLAGWRLASSDEGFEEGLTPPCLFAPGELPVISDSPGASGAGPHQAPLAEAEWDAGPMGCGDLVLELRLRLKDLAPGAVLRVRATDTGAREDLPAWCRLTGHSLVASDHPSYWIRRRET